MRLVALSERFIYNVSPLHVIAGKNMWIKTKYELSQDRTEQGHRIVTNLLIVDETGNEPGKSPWREYTFEVFEDLKLTFRLTAFRMKSSERADDKFVEFYVYGFSILADKQDRYFDFSVSVRDYSVAEMHWFDAPVERIVYDVKEKGLEWLMNELLNTFKPITINGAFSGIV